jgi:hypothetical protein
MNDVNVPVFRIRVNRIRNFLGHPDPQPYPLVRDTDPRIRIHTKMLRICNTAFKLEHKWTGFNFWML